LTDRVVIHAGVVAGAARTPELRREAIGTLTQVLRELGHAGSAWETATTASCVVTCPDPASAGALALALVGALNLRLARLRVGIDSGYFVTSSDGTLRGAAVDVARDLIAIASDGWIVCTERVAIGAAGVADVRPLGVRRFDPARRPAPLYRLAPRAPRSALDERDPVCARALDPRTAPRLTIGETSHHFCSAACMSAFLARGARA